MMSRWSGLFCVTVALVGGCGHSLAVPETQPATDAGDDSATVTLGTACSTPGALACAGHAQKLQLLCDGTKWNSNGVCSGQQICDTRPGPTAGSRQDPIGASVGQAAGASFCNAAVRQTCRPDLLP